MTVHPKLLANEVLPLPETPRIIYKILFDSCAIYFDELTTEFLNKREHRKKSPHDFQKPRTGRPNDGMIQFQRNITGNATKRPIKKETITAMKNSPIALVIISNLLMFLCVWL